MAYNLFIDDERFPPDDDFDWTIARTSSNALDIVRSLGIPAWISFDHDLGGDDTSMVFLHALADHAIDTDARFDFGYYVHSQNPIGAENITGFIESFRSVYPNDRVPCAAPR